MRNGELEGVVPLGIMVAGAIFDAMVEPGQEWKSMAAILIPARLANRIDDREHEVSGLEFNAWLTLS